MEKYRIKEIRHIMNVIREITKSDAIRMCLGTIDGVLEFELVGINPSTKKDPQIKAHGSLEHIFTHRQCEVGLSALKRLSEREGLYTIEKFEERERVENN